MLTVNESANPAGVKYVRSTNLGPNPANPTILRWLCGAVHCARKKNRQTSRLRTLHRGPPLDPVAASAGRDAVEYVAWVGRGRVELVRHTSGLLLLRGSSRDRLWSVAARSRRRLGHRCVVAQMGEIQAEHVDQLLCAARAQLQVHVHASRAGPCVPGGSARGRGARRGWRS
jgi:hypothetical protein